MSYKCTNNLVVIQYFFEYIIKSYQNVTDNPPIKIYVNKTKNRITFKIRPGIIWKV